MSYQDKKMETFYNIIAIHLICIPNCYNRVAFKIVAQSFFYSQFRSEIRPFPLAIIIEFLPMVMQLMCNIEQNGKEPNTD